MRLGLIIDFVVSPGLIVDIMRLRGLILLFKISKLALSSTCIAYLVMISDRLIRFLRSFTRSFWIRDFTVSFKKVLFHWPWNYNEMLEFG